MRLYTMKLENTSLPLLLGIYSIFYLKKINKNYSLEISKNHVDYCDDHISINWEKEEKLIDSLFEMLKWCIKEKTYRIMINRKEEKPKLTCYLGEDKVH